MVLIFFCIIILNIAYRKKRKFIEKIVWIYSIGAVIAIGITVTITWNKLDVGNYMKGQNTYSIFIDDNYVDPASVNLSFPEKKINLIYIFLESMEITYADEKNGGAFNENVILELTKLAQKNEDFSGESRELNEEYSMPGTTWTMRAMFGQMPGLPLNISIDGNSMDTQSLFFPGIITLGDILQ